MRVLIVTGIFPPDIGGPATYVPQIAKALLERGYEVKVLTTGKSESLPSADNCFPYSVFRMKRRAPIWYRLPYYVWHIFRHGKDVDVIYANGLHFETALANLLLRKPLVMKVVGDKAWETAMHRGWTQDNFEQFQKGRKSLVVEWLKILRSWTVRKADKIIVPSHYLKRFVVGWGVPERKCVVIYNAVERGIETSSGSIPRFPESFAGKVKVITVARLVPWKGVDLVIRVVSNLPSVALTVVGDGPCRGDLEDLAQKMRVTERVWFAGAKPKPEVFGLFQVHDIFVLASSYEGLPHIILEAMQAGLAVIATAVGGTPEIIRHGENGLLIEPKEEALLRALKQLCDDATYRRRLAEAGQRWVREKFSEENMVERTEKELLEVVRDRGC